MALLDLQDMGTRTSEERGGGGGSNTSLIACSGESSLSLTGCQ
jgi:hypothetical protein